MKGKLFTGLAALLCFAALSACSQGRNGGEESVLQQSVSKLFKKETQARLTEIEKERSSAVLTRIDAVPVPGENGSLDFGGLKLRLPEGVTAALWEGKGVNPEHGVVLELAGAEPEEYVLPPLVCLEQYRAEYAGELSLAAAILKELQGDELVRRYADEKAGIYTFQLTKESFTCYLLVRGGEAYALWEITSESDYSIGDLLQKGRVCWDTQENAWKEAKQEKVKYGMAEIEPGFSLVFCLPSGEGIGEENRLWLYREGKFAVPVQKLESRLLPEIHDFVDVNGDGALDLRLVPEDPYGRQGRESFYIWNREKQLYEPEDIAAEDWEAARKEYDNPLTESWETVSEGVWESPADGLPEEEKESLRIPQALLDEISIAFQERRELEVLKAMTDDRMLSDEEVRELGAEDMEIRLELTGSKGLYAGVLEMPYAVMEADLDNDGILDLWMETNEGGSAGYRSCSFFQGQADGSYQMTYRTLHDKEEVAAICFEGKYYLCRTAYDYGLKQYHGVDLYCYEEGSCVEQASVRMTEEGYQVEVAQCTDSRWEALAEQTASRSAQLRRQADSWENWTGSAEQEAGEEDLYICDLDNDGTEEEYEKYVWMTSSDHSFNHLSFVCEGHELLEEMIWSGEGFPLMLWADEADGQNILQVLTITGIYDYEIDAYLVTGTEYERIYRVTGTAEIGTEQERKVFIDGNKGE
ncbi:hypothetical protein B5E77_14625 [Lachnoclostridium sp. An131]|uniref:hypothetical protein n=1 Tax=Lachnoclostridium sp. An131 TaxID=1965555 RepID=UPI000B390C0E|nr:hypothetical protein [Lachnoclostridium sp. An131]OUQ23903.1 hypothetical protein B5E77_14625 [Lachnoclostridium sp. An131]